MRTSLNWIKDLVPGLNCSPKEYMDRMTLSGSKVEFYEDFSKNLKNIVVGQIKEIEKHPDADKLSICKVDIGNKVLQIVTGAKNIKVGIKVPVVLDGGKVAYAHGKSEVNENGIEIHSGKLRGVDSDGMMCGIGELCSNPSLYRSENEEDGLYIFSDDAKVGSDAIKELGLDDVAIEYEITSNRVDCFSIIGLAREAAATFRLPFNIDKIKKTGNKEDTASYIKVTTRNKDLCKRYTARVIRNVKIEPSPIWMQKRLRSQGIRPINNFVDITNYVMEEYGQPMHAYDISTIAGNEIIVDNAKDNEKFTTLDGIERTLTNDILMINDKEKPIGIAGIMGGENSMITDSAKDILFEAACFDGTNIRLSSKKLGLRTDASSKFEKGLPNEMAYLAMERACELVEELHAGEVVGEILDVCNEEKKEVRIPFEPDKYNDMLGTCIEADTMLSYFKRLEVGYNEKTNELIIPFFRLDLLCYADIAEEVARFYGYDKIPTTLPKGEATVGTLGHKGNINKLCREIALEYGFSEAMHYSFESKKVFDKLLIKKDSKYRDAIEIQNPLGEDFRIMRTLSLNGILTSLSTNYNKRNKEACLYEIGNVYIPKSLPLTDLPDERAQLTFGFYGEGDFFNMKGVVEEVLSKVGMIEDITYDPNSNKSFLHPGRQADIIYKGNVIGYIGEVHPNVLKNYKIGDRTYIAVLDLQYIYENASFNTKYEKIINFPPSSRDISLVVPKNVLSYDIEKVFKENGGKNLESYKLFDLYEGNQIKDGFKSMAYTLTFRAKDKNLEENDITLPMNNILKELSNMGIELRK